MTNHVSILLPTCDVEELQQLLGRDDLPVDHWPLADRLLNQIEARIDEAKPRTPRAT